ncbi:hypothetical protein [Sphingomonas sp.]|uniref:hypothetical protein n=1 Tax=Sphingomonas sp. TaxID=28214 RepID=UPI003B00F2A4
MSTFAEHLVFRWKQARHGWRTRGVLATPPLRPRDDGVVIFSLIGTRVLLSYLVAVKSFHRHLGRGRVVVMDDGSLTAADRLVLARHLGDPEILALRDVDTGPAPRGGTWERLLTILDARADDYVIQLDSDTITRAPMPEVTAAIDAGRSFTLRGEADAALMPADAFVATLPAIDGRMHIQKATERLLDRLDLPGLPVPRYVRGCSGFAGFAPGDGGRLLADAFSQACEARLGADRWREWGTEQVTSNFVIANEADALLLPYDRYLNYWGQDVPAAAPFVHYLGMCRYRGRAYRDATRAAIAELRAA